MHDKTASYIELTTQTYRTIVDALSAANERNLGYVKSLFEISTRPYASSAFETVARENVDRANQIVGLSVSEMQASTAKAAEVGGELFAHASALQDAYVASVRGLFETGLSNANFVRETTARQMEHAAQVSSN